ncbi:response regulator [Spirulina sp. CCNP1310]|uniref:response regulator n=1 Tax=Spirulina sp. CCNP1310 TaxID=3110249 RepID=UPI002B21D79E|nr:response regulator [Spirulina sp. CCNP1310]MEA5420702.1 response regulator [Spirulina sp. CCNP1310]
MHRKIPLHLILTLQFVLQVLGIVGLVGYFSYRSGSAAIGDIAHRLMTETGDRIVDNFNHYLKIPYQINENSVKELRSGKISPNDLDELHRYLILTKQKYPEVSTLLWGSPQGNFLYVHLITPTEIRIGSPTIPTDLPFLGAGHSDPQDPTRFHSYRITPAGELGEYRQTVENIPVQQRPWYRQAIQAGQPAWSQPFQLGVTNQLTINAAAPVYDQQQNLLGVFGVNITLERLDKFLATLSISEHSEIFIIERNGLMIANSMGEDSFTISLPVAEGNANPDRGKFERRSVLESDRPMLREAAQVLQQKLGNFADIQTPQNLTVTLTDPKLVETLGKSYYLRVIPYQDPYGLDWLIIAVVPASDFMRNIYANVQRTLLLCGFALILSITSSLWLARRIVRSLSRLTQASQNFMTQKQDQDIQPTRIAELETLSQSFQAMMVAIQEAEVLRQNYTQDLEKQVALKTIALTEAQRLAHTGNWEVNLRDNSVTWSDEVYRIHEAEDYPRTSRPDQEILKIHPQDQEHYQRHVMDRVHSNQPFDTDVKIITHKGNIRFLHIQGQPIYDHTGKVVKFIGTTTDITARKQTEQALIEAKEAAEAANQAKSIFLANMSHELRTPLNAILGYPTLLLNSENLSAEDRSYVQTIERSGEYLLSLINQILDLSKIEAGRMVLNMGKLQLYTLLADLQTMLEPQAQAKGLSLQINKSADLPNLIQTDGVKLQQVLINLLNNAIKFTQTGSVSLTIETLVKQQTNGGSSQQLQFTITDTGVGIAPAELDSLFEAFVQTESGRNSHVGTGLGLAISQKFVALMGGELKVASTVGQGTTFMFDLAWQDLQEQPHRQGDSAVMGWQLATGEPSYRILVVDDVAENREILLKLLEKWGLMVFEARDGEEAIAQVHQHHPDLIFMDIKMPKLNGIEAIQRLHQEASDSIPKMIAFTASAFEEDRQNILAAGCDDFIRKPFRQQDILNCLTVHLQAQFMPRESLGLAAGVAVHPENPQGNQKEQSQPLKILVAEDNLVNQKLLFIHLEKLGYKADVVANGLEVLYTLVMNSYDVILMDMEMPEMDGITTTEMIRQDFPPEVQPYIIALTANDDRGDRLACEEAGMNDYLTKPIQQERLGTALASVPRRC